MTLITMDKTKYKDIKPTGCDAHFKYRCPSQDCGFFHWLSLKEAQTKNFKIVCDCGSVFSPKRIKKIKIAYLTPVSKQQPIPFENKKKNTDPPDDLLQKGSEALIKYGFTKKESLDLLKKAFIEKPIYDMVQLIKVALTKVGEA
jgi:hypothetical protein